MLGSFPIERVMSVTQCTAPLYVPYKVKGMEQDRFTVSFRQTSMVRIKCVHSLTDANELLGCKA